MFIISFHILSSNVLFANTVKLETKLTFSHTGYITVLHSTKQHLHKSSVFFKDTLLFIIPGPYIKWH